MRTGPEEVLLVCSSSSMKTLNASSLLLCRQQVLSPPFQDKASDFHDLENHVATFKMEPGHQSWEGEDRAYAEVYFKKMKNLERNG